jgi:hypothetical protein
MDGQMLGHSSLSSMIQFKALNELKTGNQYLDMIIFMGVMWIFKFITGYKNEAIIFMKKLFLMICNIYLPVKVQPITKVHRSITVKRMISTGVSTGEDKSDATYFLHRAIFLYITNISNFDKWHDINATYQYKQSMDTGYHSSDRLIYKPKNDIWVPVTDKIECMTIDIFHNNDKTSHYREITIKLRANYNKEIDKFLKEALMFFQTNQRKLYGSDIKKIRYFLLPSSTTIGSEIAYNKYPIYDTKTFNSLFIPNKEKLLSYINNFTKSQGKFGVEGVTKQLGILMSGPPGTGKSSFIKALAQHTNRHIIEIPLSKIKTNSQLFSMMFSGYYYIDGALRSYPANNVIFSIEDIDCVSNIVHKRKITLDKDKQDESKNETIINYSDSDEYEKDNLKFIKKDCLKHSKNDISLSSDKLNLSGLLNVIDGIVECPERIIIMTTNHPEKLDPALIRPGRIHLNIYMDFIKYHEAKKMLEHFMFTITVEQNDKLTSLFKAYHKITPALLESLCITFDNINEIINYLESNIQLYQ